MHARHLRRRRRPVRPTPNSPPVSSQASTVVGLVEKGSKRRLPLRRLHHGIEVNDVCARISSTQEYVNDVSTAVELLYRFALTDTSTPCSLRATLLNPATQERIELVGEVKPKQQAEEEYDDTIAEGGTAMLLQVEAESIMGLSIGNVGAGWHITIVYEWVQELEVEKSDADDAAGRVTSRLRLQAMHNSKDSGSRARSRGAVADQTLLEVTLHAKLSDGILSNVTSPSHPTALHRLPNANDTSTDWSLTTTGQALDPEKDFVVECHVSLFPIASWLVQQVGEEEGLYAHCVTVLPHFTDVQKEENVCSEMVLIVDRSGSMKRQNRIQYAKRALKLFLQSLDEDQKILFNIVSFGSEFSLMNSRSLPFNQKNFQAASRHVDAMQASMGGTDIMSVIDHVLQMRVRPGFSRQIFLMTDGEDGQTPAIIKAVRRDSDSTRVFAMGIGEGINPLLCDGVAKASGGRAVFLDDPSTIQTKVMEQLAFACQPSLHNVRFDFLNMEEANLRCAVGDSRLPVMFNGTRYTRFFFSDSIDPSTAEIQVSYSLSNSSSPSVTHAISPTMIVDQPNSIAVLAARSRIVYLETEVSDLTTNPFGPDQARIVSLEAEIERLGLTYGIVSSKTSLMTRDADLNSPVADSAMQSVKIPTIVYRGGRRKKKPVGGGKRRKRGRRTRPGGLGGVRRGGRGRGRVRGLSDFGNVRFSRMKKGKSLAVRKPAVAGSSSLSRSRPLSQRQHQRERERSQRRSRRRRSSSESLSHSALSSSSTSSRRDQRQQSLYFLDESDDFDFDEEVFDNGIQGPMDLGGVLLLANLKGVWSCNAQVATALSRRLEDILRAGNLTLSSPDAAKNLWMTAVVVAYFQVVYAREQAQWLLVVRKAKKEIRKGVAAGTIGEDTLARALTFVLED